MHKAEIRCGVPFLLRLLAPAPILFAAPAAGATLAVGTGAYPTLAAAVAAIPRVRAGLAPGEAIEIAVPAGLLRLTSPIMIDAAHGGTREAPLVIRGVGAGRSRLVGSVPLVSRAATVGDTGGRAVPSGARALDLAGLPIAANLVRRGSSTRPDVAGIELYQGTAQLTPSRWPAVGLVDATTSAVDPQATVVAVPGARAAAWRAEPAAWAGGYWGADWSFELTPVAAVAPNGASIRLAPLTGQPAPRRAVRYFVENLLSELRQPGTFFVDPQRRTALFLPVVGGGAVEAAVAPSLLILKGARNVSIADLAFDRALGTAVKVQDSEDIAFVRCAFRQTGGAGVAVTGGRHVTFDRSVIADTAEGGLRLIGGDRPSLTPAGHAFSNGIIADFGQESRTYRPAVELAGVGNRLTGSLLMRGPHNAVMVSGNDLVVSGNEIAQVLRETDDAGTIYMGADWSQRGIEVSGNYVHNLGGTFATQQLSSVYLDDQFSSAHVAGNVFVGGDFSVFIGGGRDNAVERNLFVNPRRAGVRFDARGLNLQRARQSEFVAKLAKVGATSPLWLQHYPALRSLTPARYGHPDGDSATGNVTFGAPILSIDTPAVTALLASQGNSAAPRAATDPATLSGLVAHMPGAMPPLADRARALAALVPMLAVPAR